MVDHLVTMANLRAPGGNRKGKGVGREWRAGAAAPAHGNHQAGQSGSTRRAPRRGKHPRNGAGGRALDSEA